MSRGGDASYDDNSGKTLTVADKNNTVTFYVMRRFGKHFGLYLGGGMQASSFDVLDEGNMAGTASSNGGFKGEMTVPYGEAGLVLGGWQMARAMLAALEQREQDPAFFDAKLVTARFYAEALLPQAQALSASVRTSGATVDRMAVELF